MDSFRCLAIETATQRAGVAVLLGDRLVLREAVGHRSPSRLVYTWIAEVLRESGMELTDLHCVAYGAGPGSFTGLRVAAAVAQALGYAGRLPVCRVSTLAAMALAATRPGGSRTAAALLDARMGQVYLGVYRAHGDRLVEPIIPDQLVTPTAWTGVFPPGTVGVGPGWSQALPLYEQAGDRLVAIDTNLLPSAEDVARLACAQFRAGDVLEPAAATPNYLRDRVTS